MGVEYLNVQTGAGRATLANFTAIKKRMEDAGLKVWNISNNDNRNIEEITLNLPGREAKMAWLKQYVQDTGKAGIGYITYAHMANGIWSSAPETTRGGGSARAFHQNNAKGYWNGKESCGRTTRGSSGRLRRGRRKRRCGSGFIRMTRRCRSWAGFRGRFSGRSMDM